MPHKTTDYGTQLGGRIRDARVDADLTQTQLAVALDMDRSSVANMEAGRQRVLAEMVMTLSRLLGCDPCWLLTGRSQHRVLLDYLDGVKAAAGARPVVPSPK